MRWRAGNDPGLPTDAALRNQLSEVDSAICSLNVTVYDARRLGGFIAFAFQPGELDCVALQVVLIENGVARIGPGLANEGGRICDSATVHVIREGNQAFPAVLLRNVVGPQQSYELNLFAPDAAAFDVADPLCRIAVTYQPAFAIEHWMTVPGSASAPQILRDIVEPILMARAKGQDVAKILERWRDHPSGSSDYDVLIRFADPIMRLTSSEMIRLEFGPGISMIPSHDYRQWTGDFMPLRVDGHRYLLRFGQIEWGQRKNWRNPGFEIWEWFDGAFTPVVAGNLMRRASPDLEIDVSP
jgi:hypothetical protein